MLCSTCNKNMAVIFTKKLDGTGGGMEGLCYSCAKEKGINPLDVLAKQANLSDSELNDMSKQFESIFEDLSENLDIDSLEMDGMDNNFSSIISNMFSGRKDSLNESMDTPCGKDAR